MKLIRRSLSPQESRVVLALAEHHQREATRADIIRVLGGSAKAVDNVIESLRRKGWLERATWGKYLLVPADQGPDAIGDSNLLALASRITERYYMRYYVFAKNKTSMSNRRNAYSKNDKWSTSDL